MGFFAGELYAILEAHWAPPSATPWSLLSRMNVHPQQIDRLKKAADDIGLVATLKGSDLQRLRDELDLSLIEWARLQAGMEADIFLRLLLYHTYPLYEAANKANMIFAAELKDRLMLGGRGESKYVPDDVMMLPDDSEPKTRQSRRRPPSSLNKEEE
jgi:hypothetical protein